MNRRDKYDSEKIRRMREGGKIIVQILGEVLENVEPGVTTRDLDELAEDLCKKNNVKPAFKGYKGFPSVICVGPNEQVVHGIPDDKKLKKGDILSVDMGIIYEDVYLDMARTVPVGEISNEAKKFVNTVRDALQNAINAAVVGNTVGDIGHAIQSTVERVGYSVVREMVGHGVGYDLHEDPIIPGYGEPGEGESLYKGQTLAIEAIINQGASDIKMVGDDGWTTVTKDGMLSALFENTVLVGDTAEILTPLELRKIV